MELSAKDIQKFSKYSVAKLKAKAQTVFNKFIRERDKDLPCISCQKGRVENAGHYLSQGHYSIFRFNELNTNGQCIRCNKWLSGNLIHYRTHLIEKIGEAEVIKLEQAPKAAYNWDRFTLISIIINYKAKCKSLAAQ